MRFMGLDVGDKRIGVALSDPEGMLASAFSVVKRVGKKKDAWAIASLAEEQGVDRIIVGLPLKMDGTEGEQARKVREFVQALSTRTRIPIEYWDETLTTVEAERLLREAGRRPAERKERIDAVAAAVILQGYLDSHERDHR